MNTKGLLGMGVVQSPVPSPHAGKIVNGKNVAELAEEMGPSLRHLITVRIVSASQLVTEQPSCKWQRDTMCLHQNLHFFLNAKGGGSSAWLIAPLSGLVDSNIGV